MTTNDGGVNWSKQTSGTPNWINSIYFPSTLQGWVVDDNGTIMTTNNGGSSWIKQVSGTSNSLYSVFFASSSQGWAVGRNGTILHSNNGGSGLSVQENWQPNEIQSEVYPNPSRGEATIKFKVESAETVTLVLYDINGKKIDTFLNEFKSVGEYVLPIKMDGFNKGVYFYTLQIGTQIETKKIVIL